VIDDTANQTARRVAIHQAVDRIVDVRRQMGGDGTAEALSDALDHLSAVALDDGGVGAWEAVAAIAQGQLEQALEARAR
jgi:uncharacterized protein with von Willebrand factor type A (vWA) domain